MKHQCNDVSNVDPASRDHSDIDPASGVDPKLYNEACAYAINAIEADMFMEAFEIENFETLVVWVNFKQGTLHITPAHDIRTSCKYIYGHIYPEDNLSKFFNLTTCTRNGTKPPIGPNHQILQKICSKMHGSILSSNVTYNQLAPHPLRQIPLNELKDIVGLTSYLESLECIKLYYIYEDFEIARANINYYNQLMAQLLSL